MTLQEKYRASMSEVFEQFQTSNPVLPSIIAASCVLKNGAVLLTGTYGTGKSTLSEALAKRLFLSNNTTSYQRINCYQELMDTDVLYRVDFRTDEISPRKLLTTHFRYINELPRSNPALQNALLSFLAERQVSFRDSEFHVTDGLTFFDRNPFDIGAEGVVNALLDRIDVEIIIPVNDYLQKTDYEPSITTLCSQEMTQIWQQVKQVNMPSDMQDYAHLLNRYFSACVKNRTEASRLFQLPCEDCGYRGEICRSLRETPGVRGKLSMENFAKALAWYNGRKSVTVNDLELSMPYVYSHRLDFHHEVFTEWPNPQIYLHEFLINGQIEAKRERWLEAINYKLQNDLPRLKQLAGETGDLVLAWLHQKTLLQQQSIELAY